MPPRPLHHWKSFWLGLLVLIFLGWAWVRSMHHVDDIYYEPSTSSKTWGATSGLGAVLLTWEVHPFPPNGLNFDSYPVKPSWPTNIWFPKAITLQERGTGGSQYKGIAIAHWFLILLFLVAWAGFLFWRVRRMRSAGEMPPPVEH